MAGTVGVPKVYAVTTEGSHNLLVMQLLGPSLEDLFQRANRRFSAKCALMAGLQMLERVESLHEKGYLHRDIKPDNFLAGKGDPSLIYMIDLGLAKRFLKDGLHIPYCTGKELTGTARYASINTHMGYQQARRDDVESIGYVVVYLAKGCLPWQNLKAQEKKSKYDLIRDRKLATPVDVLCYGLPASMAAYLAASKALKF
jgi:casein kinase 1